MKHSSELYAENPCPYAHTEDHRACPVCGTFYVRRTGVDRLTYSHEPFEDLTSDEFREALRLLSALEQADRSTEEALAELSLALQHWRDDAEGGAGLSPIAVAPEALRGSYLTDRQVALLAAASFLAPLAARTAIGTDAVIVTARDFFRYLEEG